MVYPHQYIATGTASFLLGILVSSRFTLALPAIIAGLFLVGLMILLSTQPLLKLVSVAIAGLVLGWWRYDVATALPNHIITRWAGQTVQLTGIVVSDPTIVGTSQRFHLRASLVNNQFAAGKVLMSVWPLPHYQYGDRLSLTTRLDLPESFDDFDYPAYLARDGVYLLGRAESEIQLVGTPQFSVRRSLYQFRHFLSARLRQIVPQPSSTFLGSVLLGLRHLLSDDLKTALQNSGTTHIVALSGLHLSTIAGFFIWALRGLRRRWVWWGTGVGILLFVVMAGAPASVIRAAIMAWVMLLAAIWGRRRDTANAILLAAASMVAINPLILQYNIGFQLSLAATAGIVYLAPMLLHWFRRWPIILQAAAATTLSATVATLPLTIFHFGGVSAVTLLANLAVVPLIPLLMIVGFITVGLSVLFPAWQWLGLPAVWLSSVVMGIINWFGHWPMAYLSVPPLSPLWPSVYYLVIVGFIYHRRATSIR